MLLQGNISVFVDGQREVVSDFGWMSTFISTMINTKAPIDPLLVNETNGEWKVYRGKQRMTAMMAFFLGRVPIFHGESLKAWCSVDHPRHGWDVILQDANTPVRLKQWIQDTQSVLGQTGLDTSHSQMTKKQKQVVLDTLVDIQVLPGWPADAAGAFTVWSQIRHYTQTPSECVYAVPGLIKFKKLEGPVQAIARTLGIHNNNKRAFADMMRAYMYLNKTVFIPTADSPDDYDSIVNLLLKEFVILKEAGNHDAFRKLQSGVETMVNLIRSIASTRITKLSSDALVCFICATCLFEKGLVIPRLHFIGRVFRASRKQRSALFSAKGGARAHKLWEEGMSSKNLVKIIDAFIDKN
jgi:hypothetical protein